MTYESWRISFQSSEQAARTAYAKVEELAARLAELEGQEPVARTGWRDINDIIADREKDPSKAAALNRARQRLATESAPKAVRLTQEEIKAALKVNTMSSLVMRISRSIETAVLERNGLKPQAKGG